MRDAAIAIIREIGVEAGGCNIQFAVNPTDGEMLVIEMNPRVSRSSALASKATGFPIARIGTKLAVATRSTSCRTTSRRHPRVVRAGARLRGGQGATVRVREVSHGGLPPHDADEVRGRGDAIVAPVRTGRTCGHSSPTTSTTKRSIQGKSSKALRVAEHGIADGTPGGRVACRTGAVHSSLIALQTRSFNSETGPASGLIGYRQACPHPGTASLKTIAETRRQERLVGRKGESNGHHSLRRYRRQRRSTRRGCHSISRWARSKPVTSQ